MTHSPLAIVSSGYLKPGTYFTLSVSSGGYLQGPASVISDVIDRVLLLNNSPRFVALASALRRIVLPGLGRDLETGSTARAFAPLVANRQVITDEIVAGRIVAPDLDTRISVEQEASRTEEPTEQSRSTVPLNGGDRSV